MNELSKNQSSATVEPAQPAVPNPQPPAPNPQPTLCRRRLLKALGATGGTLAASMLLPEKWENPLIEVGYLPAHAQVSGFIIFDLARDRVEPIVPCLNNGDEGQQYQVTLHYESSFGDVLPGSIVDHSFEFSNGLSGSFERVMEAENFEGDGFSGTITYFVCTAFGSAGNDSVMTTVVLTTTAGRHSNQLSVTTSRPVDALGANFFEG